MATPADEDSRAEIEVELRDALSVNAKKAARSTDEMTDEVKALNRQLLILDKRADKAAISVAKLDASVAAFTGRASKANDVLADLNKTTAEYTATARKATKAVDDSDKAHRRATKSTRAHSRAMMGLGRSLRGVVRFLPMMLMYGVLGTLLAGGIAPALQLGAALASLAGFLVVIPGLLGAAAAGIATLVVGFKGVGKALSAMGDAGEFQEAIKDLAPAAQAFLKELRKFRDQFKDIRKSVQQALFDPFKDKLRPALNAMLPILKTGMTNVATTMGQTISTVFDHFITGRGQAAVASLFRSTNRYMQVLRNSAGPVLDGLGALVISLEGSMDKMFGKWDGWGQRLGAFLTRIADSGEAAAWFETAMVMGGQLLDILQMIGGIILDVTAAAGGMSFSPLLNILSLIQGFTSSTEGQMALVMFFDTLRGVLAAVAPLVVTLGSAIGTVLVPILGSIIKVLAPFADLLVKGIADALQMTMPMWPILASAVGTLVQALLPILPVVGEVLAVVGTFVGQLVSLVAPLIGTFLSALSGPLVSLLQGIGGILTSLMGPLTMVFDALGDHMTRYAPILSQIIMMLADGLVEALSTMLPLFESLAPVITDFIKLYSDQMMEVFEALLPMLPDVIDGFMGIFDLFADPRVSKAILDIITAITDLAAWLLPMVVDAVIKLMPFAIWLISWIIRFATVGVEQAAIIGGFISNIIQWFRDLPTKIKEGLSTVGHAISAPFKEAFNAVVRFWNRTIGGKGFEIPSWVPFGFGGRSFKFPTFSEARAEGGPTVAGKQYLVGELGKELWMPSDGGDPKYIGVGGPEHRTFGSDGFVIPNYMVKSMERAGDGMAQELARMEASHSQAAETRALVSAMASNAGDTNHYEINQHFHNAESMTPRDVERAVERALKKAEQDRRERT